MSRNRDATEDKINKISLYKIDPDCGIAGIIEKYILINSGKNGGWEYSIFIRTTPPKHPAWLPLIKNMVDVGRVGKNVYSSLIILFKKEKHLFALTAGYGYVDVFDSAVQDYGIHIALRAADPHGLKALIQKTPIGNVFSFNRVLRGKYIPESDSINKKSVLRHIVGKCLNVDIGHSISGTTSLTVSGEKSFGEVVNLLGLLIEVEGKDPVVKISGLKQAPEKIYDSLNAALVEKVRNKLFDDLFICYDDEKVQMACERVKIGKEIINFDDVDLILETVIGQNGGVLDGVCLQGLDENNEKLPKKKVMDLLEGQVKYNDKTYFRINKKWYEANEETIQEIEKEFSGIEVIEVPYLKDWIVKSGVPEKEGDFLEKVYQNNANLIPTHQRKLVSGNIEFSDIYDPDKKYIIHVKKGRGAFLRCLFSQSYVSGKLFAGDGDFKKEVEEKFSISSKNHAENEIILAIFNPDQKNDPFTLFAKVDLVERVSALKENGYSVKYCLIAPKYEI